MSTAELLQTMKNDRDTILSNLVQVRIDIKKYEARLKPKVFKNKPETGTPPPEEDLYHESDSDSL